MATTSYAGLDPHWKTHLARLHDEYLEGRQVSTRCLPLHGQSPAQHMHGGTDTRRGIMKTKSFPGGLDVALHTLLGVAFPFSP
jgi:hypothetical protein